MKKNMKDFKNYINVNDIDKVKKEIDKLEREIVLKNKLEGLFTLNRLGLTKRLKNN
jgi:hypothetical protein